MAGRKVRDVEEARSCLAAVAAGDVPLAEWARAHGLDGRSLNLWRVNLARTPRRTVHHTAPELRLVELVAAPPVVGARYRICLGDLAVEVGDTFDDAVLRRLLRVVVAC